ncbi:MAG: lytic transglycosylase domain-containing protein [Acidimicrobiales bacterium]
MTRPFAAAALVALAACNPGADDPTLDAGDTGTTSTAAAGASSTSTTAVPSTTAAPTTAGAATTTVPTGGVGTLPEGSPTTVADALGTSEAAIRDAATPATDLERHGRAQQVAYRQLAVHPEWLDQVLDRLPDDLHGIVRAHTSAGIELRALTKPQTALPPWRIVAPAPADELLRYYKEADAAVGAPWNYLAAIHLVETRMGRIRGTSTAGAQGPMQFLPSTWEQYGQGGDIDNNRDAIFAAARLLVRNGAPGNMSNALFNYNRSTRYVSAITAYAEQMGAAERAYYGYYHWQVYYRMADGDRLLAVGYGT